MEPTISADETFKALTYASGDPGPNRLDAVIFTPPKDALPHTLSDAEAGNWIFRVVGLPGDSISFDSGSVLINGAEPMDQPDIIKDIRYTDIKRTTLKQSSKIGNYPFMIPEDQFFVLGDNPNGANDSRFWGLLPRSNIVAIAIEK